MDLLNQGVFVSNDSGQKYFILKDIKLKKDEILIKLIIEKFGSDIIIVSELEIEQIDFTKIKTNFIIQHYPAKPLKEIDNIILTPNKSNKYKRKKKSKKSKS